MSDSCVYINREEMAGTELRMEKRNAHRLSWENLNGRDQLEDLGIDGRSILKMEPQHSWGSPCWETSTFSATQKIPCILWNPNVQHRVHNSTPPVPVLTQINTLHGPHPISWPTISIITSHLRLSLPSGLFPSGFSTKTLHAPIQFPICVTMSHATDSSWYHRINIW